VGDSIAASYDAVAHRYAEEIGDELAGKPVDRAFLSLLTELTETVDNAVVADVGCGPGHVAAFLADLGLTVVGIDLSPAMVEAARRRYPDQAFAVGSLLDLPVRDQGWAGAVCAYSIIHLTDAERPAAFAELARGIMPGGWLLLSFHICDAGAKPGDVTHLSEWWGQAVDLDFHYLDPDRVAGEVTAAGFSVMTLAQREPWPGVEHESRRCHLLARRNAS